MEKISLSEDRITNALYMYVPYLSQQSDSTNLASMRPEGQKNKKSSVSQYKTNMAVLVEYQIVVGHATISVILHDVAYYIQFENSILLILNFCPL